MNKAENNSVPLVLKQLTPRGQFKCTKTGLVPLLVKQLIPRGQYKCTKADYDKLKKKCDKLTAENFELKQTIEPIEQLVTKLKETKNIKDKPNQ